MFFIEYVRSLKLPLMTLCYKTLFQLLYVFNISVLNIYVLVHWQWTAKKLHYG